MTIHQKLDYLMNNNITYRFISQKAVNNNGTRGDITSSYTIGEDGKYIIVVNCHAGDSDTTSSINLVSVTCTGGNVATIHVGKSYCNNSSAYSSSSVVGVYSLLDASAGDVLTIKYNGLYCVGSNIIAIKA